MPPSNQTPVALRSGSTNLSDSEVARSSECSTVTAPTPKLSLMRRARLVAIPGGPASNTLAVGMTTMCDVGPPASVTNVELIAEFNPTPPCRTRAPCAGPCVDEGWPSSVPTPDARRKIRRLMPGRCIEVPATSARPRALRPARRCATEINQGPGRVL